MRPPRDEKGSREDWESRLRFRPSQERVRALVAWCALAGEDADAACLARWGAPASLLIRGARRPRKGDRLLSAL
jgi:hypothetical protein